MPVACDGGFLRNHVLHVSAGVIIGNHWWIFGKNRIRFHRQVIQRQMRRCVSNRSTYILPRQIQRLRWQRVQQNKIKVIKISSLDNTRATELVDIMYDKESQNILT